MIEFGIIEEVAVNKATILVDFPHLGTKATCKIMTPATGDNIEYNPPPKGTQVACWLESGKNLAFGCLFSDADPVPEDIDENTKVSQFGSTKTTIKADSWKVEQNNVSMELTGNKAILKNSTTDLKTILKDFSTVIKNLMVSTGVGPSGTPLPPTITALVQLEQKIDNLLNS